MEKIIDIKQYEENEDVWDGKAGYAIITEKQTIKLLIDNHQSCCENWGYFMSEDNLNDFVGTNLIDITLTDTCLNTKKYNEMDLYEPNLMFVNISTDKGMLQFVAYNEHNGYYGHDAYVISEQLNHETYL
jgi:hypothetical protein